MDTTVDHFTPLALRVRGEFSLDLLIPKLIQFGNKVKKHYMVTQILDEGAFQCSALKILYSVGFQKVLKHKYL